MFLNDSWIVHGPWQTVISSLILSVPRRRRLLERKIIPFWLFVQSINCLSLNRIIDPLPGDSSTLDLFFDGRDDSLPSSRKDCLLCCLTCLDSVLFWTVKPRFLYGHIGVVGVVSRFLSSIVTPSFLVYSVLRLRVLILVSFWYFGKIRPLDVIK